MVVPNFGFSIFSKFTRVSASALLGIREDENIHIISSPFWNLLWKSWQEPIKR